MQSVPKWHLIILKRGPLWMRVRTLSVQDNDSYHESKKKAIRNRGTPEKRICSEAEQYKENCSLVLRVKNVRSLSLSKKKRFSWAALISGYGKAGRFYKALESYESMVQEGFEADVQSFLVLFKACGKIGDLEQGRRLHAHARKQGLTTNLFLASSILSMYGKCGSSSCAERVFNDLPWPVKDVVLWNTMLSVYSEHGHDEKVLQLYRQLHEERVRPDHTTYAVALGACSSLAEKDSMNGHKSAIVGLCIGQAVHADAHRNKLTSHVMVSSALASLYGRCGTMSDAEHAFICSSQHNVVSWTSMFSAYLEQGLENKTLQLYVHMHKLGICPDKQALAIALQACIAFSEKEDTSIVQGHEMKTMSLKIGKALHFDAKNKGFMSNLFIGSTLVNMYAKCGALSNAEDVFNELPELDIVAWTAMLSAYLDQGQLDMALKLYKRMLKLQVVVDETTFACALQACGETGRFDLCLQLYCNVVSAGYDSNPFLGSCILHACGNCCSISDSEAVLLNLFKPDLVSWNACISGYARECDYGSCMQILLNMKDSNVEPDEVTFITLLFVCSHTGHVDEGLCCFESMIKEHGISPNSKHYALLLDLLARVGDFERAKNIMLTMPVKDDLYSRSSLLGACQKHSNLELGKEIFDCTLQLQRQDYVLMSNIYADGRSE